MAESKRRLFLFSPLRFFLGINAVLLGLGFVRYFEHWVFFPWFPNFLDSMFMIGVGVILLYDVVKRR